MTRIQSWNDQLPDPAAWQPRAPSDDNLRAALRLTCRGAQRRIVAAAELEREFDIDNFDSGPALEDLVRKELRRLLPLRYDVSAGVVDDSDGRTVGDCDVVISNRQWAPIIKPGATEESRRVHFPIESLYACVEIKTTATFASIDSAMGKLVSVSRLNRASNPYGHITENQHLMQFDRPGYVLNPLFTIILASRLDPAMRFEDVARRFFLLNEQVGRTSRDEMVKMLCILDSGVAYYGLGRNDATNADFCRDRNSELTETTITISPEDVLFILYAHLLGHLTRSILNILHISTNYGYGRPTQTLCYGKVPR